jgi:hypothetical protein
MKNIAMHSVFGERPEQCTGRRIKDIGHRAHIRVRESLIKKVHYYRDPKDKRNNRVHMAERLENWVFKQADRLVFFHHLLGNLTDFDALDN